MRSEKREKLGERESRAFEKEEEMEREKATVGIGSSKEWRWCEAKDLGHGSLGPIMVRESEDMEDHGGAMGNCARGFGNICLLQQNVLL